MNKEENVKILIVDDKKENLLAMEAVFENTDYTLCFAQSGEEALKQVLKHDLAVILLDVQMPGLNGFETAQLIKQRMQSRHIPIIFVTALSKTMEHIKQGYAEGAIDYLFKPFHPDILKSKVDAFVKLYIKQREIEAQRDELKLQSLLLEKQSANLMAIISEKTKELTDTNDQLQLSQELFKKLFHFSPTMMSIRSKKDYRYIAVNRSWMMTTGYVMEDVEQEGGNLLSILKEGAQTPSGNSIPLDLQQGIINEKITYTTKSLEEREGLLSTEEVVVQDERCVISVITDTTERNSFEKEILRLDRLNLVGEMAAGIAHEVRNPMTTVLGFLQLTKNNTDFLKQNNYIDLMIDELNRANKIISEFLALAKNKSTNRKEEDLNRLVEGLFPLIQADALLENKQVILELGDCLPINVDEKEIIQLILNMCRNGLEAMSSGRKLTIKTKMENEQVILEIRDEGFGIEKDTLMKIGTPFFTTKDTGTGLGLAICYSIAARHQAKIDIKTSNKGTSFYVQFPLHDQHLEIGNMVYKH